MSAIGLRGSVFQGQRKTPQELEAEASATARAQYSDFSGGLASAVGGMKGSIKTYAGAALDALGAENLAAGLRAGAQEDTRRAQAIAPEIATTDQITDASTLGRYVAGKAGGAAGSMPLGLAGGVGGRLLTKSGAGAVVGSTLAYQPVMAGGHIQEIEADPNLAGMDAGEKLARGTGVGLAQSALEGAGTAYLSNRLLTRTAPATSLRGALRKTGTDALKGGALEGLGAAGSDALGQGGIMQADPTVAYDPRQTIEAGIGEAVGGMGVSAPAAAVANTLDYASAGKNLVADATKNVADATATRAPGVLDAAKGAAQNIADAGAMLKNTASGYLKHPELATLVATQEMPPELEGATAGEIEDWLASDENSRRDAALNIAQRTLIDREASDSAKAVAQALLDNPNDANAWKPFADGVIAKRQQERLASKIGRAGSQLMGWINKGKSKANRELTPQDVEFGEAMHAPLTKALGTTDEASVADAAMLLNDYVMSGFAADSKGEVRVPDGLVDALGDQAPQILAQTYDTLRRQGRTREFDAVAKERLAAVGKQVKARLSQVKGAADVVQQQLTPTMYRQIPQSAWADIADGVRVYIRAGKKDDETEKALDEMFGVNKDVLIEQLSALDTTPQSSLGKAPADAVIDKPVDEDARLRAVDGETGSDALTQMGEEYNSAISELNTDGDVRYLHKGQKKQAFDTEDAFLEQNIDLARKGLAHKGRQLEYNKMISGDQLKLDRVGVMDYASETGDRTQLDALIAKHPHLTHEQINQRFFVLKNEASEVDQGEAIDARSEDLLIGAGKKGSWQARTRIDSKSGNKDVSTLDHGRLYLSGDGIKTPFVTSARTLIERMWDRKKLGAFDENTADKVGSDDKLAMFASGLTSLLDAGGFNKIEIKAPDGEMFQVDSLENLPEDFVVWDSNAAKLTVGDARAEASKKMRTERAKEMTLVGDDKGPLIFPTQRQAEAAARKGQMAAEHPESGGWAVYKRKGDVPGDKGGAVDVDARRAKRADERGKGETAGPIGPREVAKQDDGKQRGARVEHHGISETEEMAAAKQVEYEATERRFDELTGLELQPRDFSPQEKQRGLEAQRDELVRKYKSLTDKIKEYEGKEGRNAVREGNLRKWRADLAAVVEKGKALAKVVPQGKTKNNMESASAALRISEGAEGWALKDATGETIGIDHPLGDENTGLFKTRADAVKALADSGIPENTAEVTFRIPGVDYSDARVLRVQAIFDEMADRPNRAREAELKEELNALKKELNAEGKAFSLENPTGQVMTADQKAEVSSYIEKVLGPKVMQFFTDQLKGSGEWSRDANNQNATIRIATTALNPLSVAHHEAMHEFFQRLLDGKYERAANVLRNAANSPLIKRQLQRHFAGQDAVLEQIENDVEERIAYMFQLWASGKLDIGTQTETVFRKIINIIRKTLGLVSQEKQLEEILQAFHDGKMAEPGAMAQVLDSQEARAKYLKKIGAKANPALKKANEWVGFAENALTGSKNPYLDALGRTLNNKTGSKGDAQGFLSAKEQANNLYMNKFANALRGVDPTGKDKDVATKADVDLALEGLQTKTWHKDPLVLRIQQQVDGVFKEMMQYMKDAGVKVFNPETKAWEEVREIKDYRIPRSWDPAKIIEHSGRFKELLLETHEGQLERIAKKANEEIAAGKLAGNYTASQEKLANGDKSEVTVEDVATAITNRLINANGQVELKESATALGFSPFAKSVNEQTLDWVDETVFAEFMEKDITKIISTYVGQITKRGEYSRRFGADGEVLQTAMDKALDFEIDGIMESKYEVKSAVAEAKSAAALHNKFARKNKLPETTWQEELGKMTLGDAEGKDIINDAVQSLEPARRAIMAMEGTLGHDISVLARKASAYTIVYQNVRLLGYALFANLIDPLGMMVRGAEFKDAYGAFKRGMRDVTREWGDLTGIRKAKDTDRDGAVRVAEMIGTVDSSGFMSQMGTIYSSQYLPEWAKNANDTFFRWNGLEAFNKSMRVGATQAAISFIKRHYENPNEHSDRYFEELGLTREDVQLGPDGALNVENRQVQQAVMRWVDGAILRPNAAIRPTMSSDPHYAVFYHLKQFMYAMHAVILKRVQIEIKNGNNDPLILLMAGYVPMMLAADSAKGLIQEATGNGQPYWQHDSVGGVVAHGVERAGLLGVGQLLVDTVNYGPLGLLGPAVEQAADIVTEPLGDSVAEATMVGPLSMVLRGPEASEEVPA